MNKKDYWSIFKCMLFPVAYLPWCYSVIFLNEVWQTTIVSLLLLQCFLGIYLGNPRRGNAAYLNFSDPSWKEFLWILLGPISFVFFVLVIILGCIGTQIYIWIMPDQNKE